MADLVTAAAIDALCGSVNDGDRHELEAGLNAAAKLIAAEALRQAAQRARAEFFDEYGYPDDADAALTVVTLNRMADELEGK